MIQHLFQIHSLCSVNSEAFTNEVFGLATDLDVLWERERASSNLLVGLLDLLGLEGWSAIEHGVENDSN